MKKCSSLPQFFHKTKAFKIAIPAHNNPKKVDEPRSKGAPSVLNLSKSMKSFNFHKIKQKLSKRVIGEGEIGPFTNTIGWFTPPAGTTAAGFSAELRNQRIHKGLELIKLPLVVLGMVC